MQVCLFSLIVSAAGTATARDEEDPAGVVTLGRRGGRTRLLSCQCMGLHHITTCRPDTSITTHRLLPLSLLPVLVAAVRRCACPPTCTHPTTTHVCPSSCCWGGGEKEEEKEAQQKEKASWRGSSSGSKRQHTHTADRTSQCAAPAAVPLWQVSAYTLTPFGEWEEVLLFGIYSLGEALYLWQWRVARQGRIEGPGGT